MKKLGSNFYMLWQGNLISQLGTHAFNIARVYWLVETLNEGYYVGFLLMLCSLTIAFFSPIGGYFADKYNKKSIIIVSDVFSGILMLILALIMFLDIAIDIKTTALFIFSMMISLSSCFFLPASHSLVPDLVSQDCLISANASLSKAFHIGQILGQGLGGILLAIMGTPLMILINGVSFILSAISEVFIRYHQPNRHQPNKTNSDNEYKPLLVSGMKTSILDSLQVIKHQSGIKALIIYTATDALLFMPIFVLIPYMVKDFYHSDSTAYGMMIGSFSVGMLSGYSIAFKLIRFFNHNNRALTSLFIARALFMLILGSVNIKYFGMISIFIIGLSISICNTYIRTYIQLNVESQFLGRVFGLMSGLSNILVPISFGLAGVSVSSNYFLAHQIIFLLGIASCFCSLWICSKKSLIQNLLVKPDNEEN